MLINQVKYPKIYIDCFCLNCSAKDKDNQGMDEVLGTSTCLADDVNDKDSDSVNDKDNDGVNDNVNENVKDNDEDIYLRSRFTDGETWVKPYPRSGYTDQGSSYTDQGSSYTHPRSGYTVGETWVKPYLRSSYTDGENNISITINRDQQ